MDDIKNTLEGNETLAALLKMVKQIFRAILPLIGLGYFTKYFEEDEAATDEG